MTKSLVSWGGALLITGAAWGHALPARAAIAVEMFVPRPDPRVRDDIEPPPAGERLVFWAQPRTTRIVVKIKAAPRRDSVTLGEARGRTALVVRGLPPAKGPGCKTWLHAQPAGYVCASELSIKRGWFSAPPAAELATGWQRLRYGVVSAEETKPRGGAGRFLRGVLRKGDGVTVSKTQGKEVILIGRQRVPAAHVQIVNPPQLQPIDVGSVPQGLRVAWAVPAPGEPTIPLYLPGQSAPALLVPRYTVLYYSAQHYSSHDYIAQHYSGQNYSNQHPGDGTQAAGIGRCQVLLPEDAKSPSPRIFEIEPTALRRQVPVTPPPEVGPDERWIDISITDQVATAYSGRSPVFAALVSTGKATRPGSFFIYRKYLTQTMANLSGAQSQYDYREVPWAQFFDGRIGLHAVLWHDQLGYPVSHGCINLSPPSAEQIFSFTGPPLPAGWHVVTGSAPDAAPLPLRGTRVIVRR